jgi:hypothetical protein
MPDPQDFQRLTLNAVNDQTALSAVILGNSLLPLWEKVPQADEGCFFG